jgi:hypothetical protein
LLDKLSKLDRALTHPQLASWLPAYFRDDAEELLEQAATDFTEVSLGVGGGKRVTVPVRERGERPVKREMEMDDFSRFTAAEGGKRSFFRTWVRAVDRRKLTA